MSEGSGAPAAGEAADDAAVEAAGRPEIGDAEIGYAAALAELEDILDELEGEAVDIDRLAERVQRAATLISLCRGRIVAARAGIEAAVAELDRSPGQAAAAPSVPAVDVALTRATVRCGGSERNLPSVFGQARQARGLLLLLRAGDRGRRRPLCARGRRRARRRRARRHGARPRTALAPHPQPARRRRVGRRADRRCDPGEQGRRRDHRGHRRHHDVVERPAAVAEDDACHAAPAHDVGVPGAGAQGPAAARDPRTPSCTAPPATASWPGSCWTRARSRSGVSPRAPNPDAVMQLIPRSGSIVVVGYPGRALVRGATRSQG